MSMPDEDLRRLEGAAAGHEDPLRDPPTAALEFLASLDLTDDDLELLLGEAPGLAWSDAREHAGAFFVRMRNHVGRIVCDDDQLKDNVKRAVTGGADAAWLALVAALGLTPGALVAVALKPLAVGVAVSGVEGLCTG
jgi:hypothetical protein